MQHWVDMGNDPRIFYKRLRLKRGDIQMTHFRSLLVNQFILLSFHCASLNTWFQKLDNSNAFNKEYEQFRGRNGRSWFLCKSSFNQR